MKKFRNLFFKMSNIREPLVFLLHIHKYSDCTTNIFHKLRQHYQNILIYIIPTSHYNFTTQFHKHVDFRCKFTHIMKTKDDVLFYLQQLTHVDSAIYISDQIDADDLILPFPPLLVHPPARLHSFIEYH